MSDENITKLFPGDGPRAAAPVQLEQPKTFDIVLETGDIITESGYLALGGYVAILANPNDSLNIKFAAEAGKVRFVRQTDEVIEDE